MSEFGSRNVGFFGGASSSTPIGLIGSGTPPYLAKWTDTSVISNSSVYDDSNNSVANRYFDITQGSKNALRLYYYENIYQFGVESLNSGIHCEDFVNQFGFSGVQGNNCVLELNTGSSYIKTSGSDTGILKGFRISFFDGVGNLNRYFFGDQEGSCIEVYDDVIRIQTFTFGSYTIGNGLYVDYSSATCKFGDYDNVYSSNTIEINNNLGYIQTYYNSTTYPFGLYIESNVPSGFANCFIGDFNGNANYTYLQVHNSTAFDEEFIKTNNANYNEYGIYLDAINNYQFGDYLESLGTDSNALFIDDTNRNVKFVTQNIYMQDGGGGELISDVSGTYGGDNLVVTIDGSQYLIKLNA